jgi:hypothetical protein
MLMTDPEEELATFLASQPSWRRKALQNDFSWSAQELLDYGHPERRDDLSVREQYLGLLKRVPEKWREHRRQLRKIALSLVPKGSAGRPRKDALAHEARRLQQEGKSHAQIAASLNRKYGPGCTTAGAISKLLASRKGVVPPDKT